MPPQRRPPASRCRQGWSRFELSSARSSEGLSQAEEEVEVRGFADVLIGVDVRLRVVHVHRVDWRIQVVAEIQPDRPDWRMVAHAQARCMREVIEAALTLLAGRGYWPCWTRRCGRCGRRIGCGRCRNLARIAVGLLNSKRACPRVSGIREDVAHVVKEHEAERVSKEGKYRRRQPHLCAV